MVRRLDGAWEKRECGVKSTVRLGLMGLGTVGSGVYEILDKHRSAISRRAGGPIEVGRVLVRDPLKARSVAVDPRKITTNPDDLLRDASIDIIVELIGCPGGSTEPAHRYIREALEAGKHVVTANKEVLAKHGAELHAVAQERGAGLYYEAAVAGGIPIVKPIRECLVANEIEAIMGIINGTTNYMLTKMSEEGASFEQVLSEAQALGYAEADPTSDVEGHDAAYKLAILASLAFETHVSVDEIYREGITKVTPEDMAYADELGYTIKLLAIAKRSAGAVEARVHPTLIPKSHPLAAVKDVFNAVFIEGDSVGELMFYGRGAGKLPTASAVVADVVEAVQNLRRGVPGWLNGEKKPVRILSHREVVSRYYIHTKVVDRPGVLAQIAQAFGDHNVSVESVIQKGRGEDPVSLVFVTHQVVEKNVQAALDRVRLLPVVRSVANVMRVEGE